MIVSLTIIPNKKLFCKRFSFYVSWCVIYERTIVEQIQHSKNELIWMSISTNNKNNYFKESLSKIGNFTPYTN